MAPTYTTINIIPKNSEPMATNNKEAAQKTKIKYKIECTGFFAIITKIEQTIIKINNKE